MTSDLGDDGRYLPEMKVVLSMLSPGRGQALAQYLEDRHRRHEDRLKTFADVAEATSGLTFEELLDRARDSDALSDLTQTIFEQASRTVAENKMRALGRALALGHLAEDDAALDELELMVSALRDLESPHIRVLHRLYTDGTRYQGILDYNLAAMFRNGTELLYAILKTLERHGLAGEIGAAPGAGRVAPKGPDAPRVWAIWDFGILLIEKLLLEGERETGT